MCEIWKYNYYEKILRFFFDWGIKRVECICIYEGMIFILVDGGSCFFDKVLEWMNLNLQ